MSPQGHNSSVLQAKLDRFHGMVERILGERGGHRDLDVIVGIPFHNEVDTLGGVIATARAGLEKLGLGGRSIVLCAGPERGHEVFDKVMKKVGQVNDLPARGIFLDSEFDGRGWSVRALMIAATKCRGPLILLPPNILPGEGVVGIDSAGVGGVCTIDQFSCSTGFSPDWIERMLEPMGQEQDLALARFKRHPLAQPVESFFAFPIIAAVFGFRLRQPIPGVAAISQKLAYKCLAASETWASETGSYGFDAWLVARALFEELEVCEVPLGAVHFRHEVGNLKMVFRQVAQALMSEVAQNDKEWLERPDIFKSTSVSGPSIDVAAPDYDLTSDQFKRRIRLELCHFDETLFQTVVADGVSDELRERMKKCAEGSEEEIALYADEWILILRRFLLAYKFETSFHPNDIIDGLYPFFLARFVTFIDEYHTRKEHLAAGEEIELDEARNIARHEAERTINNQMEMFVAVWPQFRDAWEKREEAVAPYLPRLGAWQFIPNVDVIVPQEIKVPDGHSVWAHQVYKIVIAVYRKEYMQFVGTQLRIKDYTRSDEVLENIERFMLRLDSLLTEEVFPDDITTFDGAKDMADRLCSHFVKKPTFCLTSKAAENILVKVPPTNLITWLDVGNVRGLLEKYDACTALGLAAWTDQQLYLRRVLDIIEEKGDPSWFEEATLEHAVIDLKHLTKATEIGAAAGLTRLAGRVVVANVQRGSGEKFPKLWYMLRMIKSIVADEAFSDIWRSFADEGFDFSKRVVASIRGHWGRHVMSAHNVFENKQQRIVAERLKSFADDLAKTESKAWNVAGALAAASDIYHLSITLPDATFVSLSAWTWASYSSRGGVGAPTPLSSLVERDWAMCDFLKAYLERSRLGTAETLERIVIDLIGQGKESEDLRDHLFDIEVPDAMVIAQKPRAVPPLATMMRRPLDRPMFEPIKGHSWESRYVLNSAAIRLDGKVYILYRAFGDDEISRVGLAWSKDGINLDGRLDRPIFQPEGDETECGGCEDPRVVVFDGRMWMLYTAWDCKVAQIALASIDVGDFLAGRYNKWERHGLGFPGLANKDAVLYPEKINGKYALYHRLDPNLWITYMDDLTCPWPRTGQQIVFGPRSGMMWDGVKIGAGAQPIKTTHGWLNIYHGVDFESSYRLGVFFTPLDDPAKIIYRSPNAVLGPETDYELGKSNGGSSWVPHVVFTCGAVPAEDKDVVGPDDDILVYYGAADSVMGVARASLRELVPIIDTL